MTLNGTLEDFSPAGILKVLSADGRTGAARFGGPAGCTVYLHRGQLYFARSETTDEALATALVRPGRLTADDWGRAIDASGERPMVGELLVRNGAIAPDLLASVVLSVVYDPLIDLFRDGTGEFDFETDTVHWLGPFRAFPVDAIVDEVRKRVREVDEWVGTIPSLDAWVEARRTLPGSAAQVTLLREDWELVTALSGPRAIKDLASELGRGAYSTARVVHRLQQAGLLEVVSNDADAQVVPIRPIADDVAEEIVTAEPADDLERDPLLDVGLPHRTQRDSAADPLSAHIGDTIANALAGEQVEAPAPPAPPTEDEGAPAEPIAPPTAVDEAEAEPIADNSWDASRRLPDAGPVHHEGLEPTSLDEPRPADPNAAWLADLYAQFIDDDASGGKKKKKDGTQALDVAFKSDEVEGEEKVSTLKRLLGALKKI
ncbi:MAG: DUF4388 domain-containing protein [Acidimicrobiales bacterium]|nr:DUF4388 domain-containing protein [Acidimicrobiales bacterium]